MTKNIYSRIAVIAFQCSTFSAVYSEPSPFGITINESTLADIKQKYSIKDAGINKYSEGEMYDLDPKQIKFDGVQSAKIIMSKDNKILALLTEMNKKNYDRLFSMLSKKYKLVSNKNPFVGDKEAEFIDGDTKITLIAKHMDFQMHLQYVHKDFDDFVAEACLKERAEKEKNEAGEL